MPKNSNEMAPSDSLSSHELLDLVEIVNGVKQIHKLRLTGGEPLLLPHLIPLISDLKERLPKTRMGLTTNGSLLENKARALAQAGVELLNISLDSLDDVQLKRLTGASSLGKILRGVQCARNAGFEKIKLNTVLLKTINYPNLADLVRFAAQQELEIRFIELMPIGCGSGLFQDEYVSADQALEKIKTSFPQIRSAPSTSTAKRHLVNVDGKETPIGFISSVSNRFCSACDRFRLDSSGGLYTCLREDGHFPLGDLIRNRRVDKVMERVKIALGAKETPRDKWPDRLMVRVGG